MESITSPLALDIADIVGFSGQGHMNTRMQSHELCGPCFFGCGATDAFHVYPDMNEVPGVGCLGYYLCMDSDRKSTRLNSSHRL